MDRAPHLQAMTVFHVKRVIITDHGFFLTIKMVGDEPHSVTQINVFGSGTDNAPTVEANMPVLLAEKSRTEISAGPSGENAPEIKGRKSAPDISEVSDVGR